MSHVAGVLMRRGAEFASAQLREPKKPEEQASGARIALMALTFSMMMLVMFAVEYTYGMVVATLAAVEDSNPDIYVRIDVDDPNKPLNSIEPEPVLEGRPKPITSKLRTTIRHLRSRAGFWSRFRGFSMFVAWSMAQGMISAIIPIPSDSFIGQFFAQSFVSVLLSTWQMAWVHIIISEPSPKRFYQRIPSYRTWIKIAPAAAAQDILTAASFYLPLAVAQLAGWVGAVGSQAPQNMSSLCRFLGIVALPAVLSLLISIPARVIFIRVAASMLPEEDETVVPFDRSFGGKVQPEIVGGSGRIGLMDAWTTFDWAARVRFAKVIGKTLAIEFALALFTVLLVGAQFAMLPGWKVTHGHQTPQEPDVFQASP